jgi:hypothetical protein
MQLKYENLLPRFESNYVDHYCPNFWSWAELDLLCDRVVVRDPDDLKKNEDEHTVVQKTQAIKGNGTFCYRENLLLPELNGSWIKSL